MAGEALSHVQPKGKGQRDRLLAVYKLPGHQQFLLVAARPQFGESP
jgi:hypothetical protein